MRFADTYFLKHFFLTSQIKEPPVGLLSFVVVIPVYLEEDLLNTLKSLYKAHRPEGAIEVLLVFNTAATDTEENRLINRQHYNITKAWSEKNQTSGFRVYPILAESLAKKHAGAGLARKIGMDEALYRFNLIDRKDGIILSLDADTRVSENYFMAIEKTMRKHPESGGCLIPFSHPLEGDEFLPEIYAAITQYELHIRYYRHILQFIGFPYAFYTIGSCFGVKAAVYAANGGMNRKQAGEDFYFLNKLFPHYPFVNVGDTVVFPSSRPSLRVPFGTGPVIHQLIQHPGTNFLTYDPQAFIELKILFDLVPALYSMSESDIGSCFSILSVGVKSFLDDQGFYTKIREIADNTSTKQAFIKRFYLWFDGFKVVKYLNYVHENAFAKIPVKQAAIQFLKVKGDLFQANEEKELLFYFRKLDHLETV